MTKIYIVFSGRDDEAAGESATIAKFEDLTINEIGSPADNRCAVFARLSDAYTFLSKLKSQSLGSEAWGHTWHPCADAWVQEFEVVE